jgi:hypothetical protein
LFETIELWTRETDRQTETGRKRQMRQERNVKMTKPPKKLASDSVAWYPCHFPLFGRKL